MIEQSIAYSPHVVIVEDDENDAVILARVLQRTEIDVIDHWVQSIPAFVEYLTSGSVDLVICDYHLHSGTAMDVIRKVDEICPGTPLIVVSHQIGEKAAVELMKAGASDVVNKVDYKHLVATVSKELIELDHVREREHLTSELFNVDRERQDLQQALQKVKDAEFQSNSLLAQLNKVFESSPDGIRVIDRDFNVLRVNSNYLRLTAIDSSTSCTGKCYDFTPRDTCHTDQCPLCRALAGESTAATELKMMSASGEERQYVMNVSALVGTDGEVDGIVEFLKDVTDWQRMQQQMLHAQKMESIGQLAAGIAHEINTPTQFVGDNISFLKESFNELTELVETYEEILTVIRNNNVTDSVWQRLDDAKEKADLEYLFEEIPQAISQSEDGTTRIASIVKAMKEFSHPGSNEPELFNVNHNIQNTVTVARNEWKYVSRVDMDFGRGLPMVKGYPGEFNQTILNMIVNAAHAIEKKGVDNPGWKGTISIKTSAQNGSIIIEIRDNGSGIPKEIIERIYDPFFTTKGVGKGTGQGLAIAHSSIVDKHQGTINVNSIEGEGTNFIISLPTAVQNDSQELDA